MIYGSLGMHNQWKKFANTEDQVIELRRLCLIDDTPKNAESYFIGKSLKLLKKDWYGSVVVSYADLEQGHVGTIYKASNFKFVGVSREHIIICWNNKKYHSKAIRTRYKGALKPYALELKQALECGEASYKKVKAKNCYVYQLRNKALTKKQLTYESDW